MKKNSKIIFLLLIIGFITSCATTKEKKSVHGTEPLIKPSDIVVKGREEMDALVKAGPKP